MSRLTAAARTGAWLGVAVAGAAVGFATERYVMGRSLRGDDPYADEPFGSLRGPSRTVTTDDGVDLHVEIDNAPTKTTMIFTHGYALTQNSWHFQRRDLSGRARMAFWDMRSHGSSSRPSQDTDDNVSLDRLTTDLEAVIDAVAPKGRVILVGHSLGGMVVMNLALRRPELFGSRVAGVGLIATSARGIHRSTLGLPGPVGRAARRAAPGVVSALARKADLVEQGRRAGGDLGFVLTRRYSFAGGSTPALVEFTAAMNSTMPVDILADFLPILSDVDTRGAFEVLAGVPTLVISADHDLIIPIAHAREVAEGVEGAGSADVQYIEAEDTGHMVMLERHEMVTERLGALFDQVDAASSRRRARTPRTSRSRR